MSTKNEGCMDELAARTMGYVVRIRNWMATRRLEDLAVDELTPVHMSARRQTYLSDLGGTFSVYRLEDGSVERIEVTLSCRDGVDLLADGQYERLVHDFLGFYTVALALLSAFLGSDGESDGDEVESLKEDFMAIKLTVWVLGEAKVMLQLKHEDRETPMRLCIVAVP